MYKDEEWSGLLFFKVVKGDLDNLAEMEFQTVDFILQDVGSKGHTQFSNEDDLVELFIGNDDLARSRMGLMHSHNTMNTFFSGEDMDEIDDNSVDCDFYLSLIVNNKFEPKCKIAFRGKYKTASYWERTMKTIAGGIINVPREKSDEGEALYTADVEVFVPDLESLDRDLGRFHDKKEAERKARYSSQPKGSESTSKSGYQGYHGEYNRPPHYVSPRQKQIDFTSKEFDVSEAEFEVYLSKLVSLDMLFEGSIKEACKHVAMKVTEEGDVAMYAAYIIDNLESYYEQIITDAPVLSTYSDTINLEKRIIAVLKDYIENCEPVRKLYYELSKDVKDNEALAKDKDQEVDEKNDEYRGYDNYGGQREFID